MQGFYKEPIVQKMWDLLIAPHDALDNSKAMADIVLTGVRDELVINEAIKNFGWGATVGVFYGNMFISSPVIIPPSVNFKGLDPYNSPNFYIEPNYHEISPTGFPMVKCKEDTYKALVLSNLYFFNCDWDGEVVASDVRCIDEVNTTVILDQMNLFADNPVRVNGKSLYGRNLYIGGNGHSIIGSVAADFINCDVQLTADYPYNNLITGTETGFKFDASSKAYLNGLCFDARASYKCTNPIIAATSNIQIEGCYGLKFQNKGQANIAQGATSLLVNHGLAFTPTLQNFKSMTPDKNCNWWISNITATQFTINIESAAPAGGINFGWSIEY